MTRSTSPAIVAGLMLLAGCSGAKEAGNTTVVAGDEAVTDNNTVEDLPSNGLAAPANMMLETESDAAGNAGGGTMM